MKKSISYFLFLCLLLTGVSLNYGQRVNKIGTSAATFLRIPVGAQAVGMGSAFVSMEHEPSSLYWNPAATASLTMNAFLIDHTLWMPGINFDFIGAALPLKEIGTIGLSLGIMHTNDMEITTPAQPMGTGEMFNASSFVVGVSFSRNLTDKFSIGGTFKYIRETIYNDYASAIGFDVGTLYHTPFEGIRLGASISNFGTKLQMTGEDLSIPAVLSNQQGTNQSITARLNTDAFDLPLIMRIGISDEVIQTDELRVTVAVDGVSPNDNAQSVNLGCEIGFYKNSFLIRGGYKDLFLPNNETNFTFGTSLRDIKVMDGVIVEFDYGFQNFVHLGSSNRFTLQVKL